MLVATIAVIVFVVLCAAFFAWMTQRSFSLPRPASRPEPLLEERLCSGCVFFDLEEGQAFMRQHRAFFEAASHLPPSEMGRQVDPETELPIDRDIPAKANWAEFGACSRHREGVWGRTDGKRRLHVMLPANEAWPSRLGDCWSSDRAALAEEAVKIDARLQDQRAAQQERHASSTMPKAAILLEDGDKFVDEAMVREVDVRQEPPDPAGGLFKRDPQTGDLIYLPKGEKEPT